MEEDKTYILGGGIAGLIWAFYNQGKVISPEFGGQMANHFPLGPRYLHRNEYSVKFLQDLKLPIKEITVRAGYQTGKGHLTNSVPSESFKQRYYMKSRGADHLEGYDDTTLSGGMNSFSALEIDFNEVINKLVESLSSRLIKGTVKKIDVQGKNLTLETGEIIFYDKLINTMPLNIFSKIVERCEFPDATNFICQPVTYVWLKNESEKIYDYVYVAQEDIKYHRITYDNKGLIVDWFGHHTKEECQTEFGDKFVDCYTLWNAQIIPYNKPLHLSNVVFVGRYGTWDRHWKTEKVIEEALKYKNNNRITWQDYYMKLAYLISERSTCPRKHVGAIIVKNNRIIGTGYNGAPRGMAHCNDVGCLIEDNHCIRVIHAEQNALLQAGSNCEGAVLYSNLLPCPQCIKLCIQAGIKTFIYAEDYNKSTVDYWIQNGGIKLVKWKN